MNVIRVFPRRTSFTPRDDMAFVGDPPLIRPEAEAVHVSVTFTWDRDEGKRLVEAWAQYYPTVLLGGPAERRISGAEPFWPGVYVKPGVTFTSRGCNNACPWCLVPEREGRLRELTIQPGHIVNDNNLLQCSRKHIADVFRMLKDQPKAAVFSGGIDARLVDDSFSNWLTTIRVDSLFLACDTDRGLEPLAAATRTLAWLGREKLRCYVMIGRNETPEQAEARLRRVWELGCIPFAQLYQPPDQWIEYSPEWRALARTWSRPAAMRALMRGASL